MNPFDEVNSNKIKSWILMFVFVAIIIALGYVFGKIFAANDPTLIILCMIIAFIIAVFIAAISYYYGDEAALSMSKAKPANKKQHAHYINCVEGLAIAAQIPTPKIYVLPDESINAFATGRDIKNSSIAVTEGALKKLKREELEGVIAHEMAHIKNYDIRLMTITVILVGLIAILSDVFLRGLLFGGGDDDNGGNWIFLVVGIVLAILAPIIAQLIQLAISRRREYAADAQGAVLGRNPQALASALKRIKKEHLAIKNTSKATAHLYISTPLEAGFWNNLFSTHPPLDERIRRLEAM